MCVACSLMTAIISMHGNLFLQGRISWGFFVVLQRFISVIMIIIIVVALMQVENDAVCIIVQTLCSVFYFSFSVFKYTDPKILCGSHWNIFSHLRTYSCELSIFLVHNYA